MTEILLKRMLNRKSSIQCCHRVLAFLGRGHRTLWVGNLLVFSNSLGKTSQMKMFLIFCTGCLKVPVVILRNKEQPDERKSDDNY